MVAAFPVAELDRRRSSVLRVSLPDDPETTPRQRSSHITSAIVAPTSLTVRLRVSFIQWYRRYYTRCDAIESPILMRRLLTGYAVPHNRRSVLKEADETIERRQWLQAQGYDFQKVVSRAGELSGMNAEEVIKPGKQPQRVKARSLVCYWAVLGGCPRTRFFEKSDF